MKFASSHKFLWSLFLAECTALVSFPPPKTKASLFLGQNLKVCRCFLLFAPFIARPWHPRWIQNKAAPTGLGLPSTLLSVATGHGWTH